MAQLKASLSGNSFTMPMDAGERKNRIKSALYTALIVIDIALILWYYTLQIEIPVPLPEAHEVEVVVEPPPAGGGGGGGSPSSAAVPIAPDPSPQAQTPRSVQETTDEEAVEQIKTPEVPVPEPDNTLEEMKRRREEAKKKTSEQASNPNSSGVGTGRGPGTGSGVGPGKGSGTGGGIGSGNGPGIGHDFGSGRSFRAGNTSTDCHEAGKVVLEVQLLPNGKIIFLDEDPATTGSPCLVKAAKEILRNSSFNSSERPASNGTITFIFKLN